MKKYIVLSFLMVFNLCFSFGQNKVVKDFKLRNVDGKYISLSDYKSAKGFIIIFTCNHCPLQNYIHHDSMSSIQNLHQKVSH